MSTPSLVLPDAPPTADTSAVPYTAPRELAATGLGEGAQAGLLVAGTLLVIGTVLVLARRSAR